MTLRRIASLAGALVVAAIAALASYSHMRGLALRFGQPEPIADLLPISVDGMMVVATVALGDGRRHRWSAWLAFWTGVGASVTANVLAAQPSTIARCISAWPAVAFLLVVEVITRGGRVRPHNVSVNLDVVPEVQPQAVPAADTTLPTVAGKSTGTRAPRQPSSGGGARKRSQKHTRRPINQTRELAANLRAKFPTITQAELARQLGITATRLRQIDRTEPSTEHAQPTNGHTNNLGEH